MQDYEFADPEAAPPLHSRPVGPPPSGPEHGASPMVRPDPNPDYVRSQGEPHVPGPREYGSMTAALPNHDIYGPSAPPLPGMAPPRRPPPMPYHTQAIGQSPVPTSGRALGVTMVTLGAGVAAGAKLGGWAGAGAGLLLTGGVVNVVRASRAYLQGTEQADKEGRIAATFGLIGLGAGGAVAYRYVYQPRQGMRANPDDDDTFDDPRCGIRPAGP